MKPPAKMDPVNPFPPRFVFHGNAVSADVIIRRMGKENVYRPSPIRGQSVLAVIGGHSDSLVQTSDPEFDSIFAHGECRTQADGILKGNVAMTTLSASVRDLRMTNRPSQEESPNPQPVEFRAGLLSLAMRSTHARKGPSRIEFSEPPQFQGLVLDQRPIQVELRREFLELSTMAELDKRFAKDRRFFDQTCGAFMRADPKRPLKFGQKIPRVGRYAVSSIVQSLRWGDQKIEGHVLTRVGFGTLYFGEILLNEYNRRVLLLRVKMGSEIGADAALVEGDPNGDWVPPEN